MSLLIFEQPKNHEGKSIVELSHSYSLRFSLQSVIIIAAIISCVVANPQIVSTLVSDINQNTLHIQSGPPIGASVSAVLPSVGTFLPVIQELAPLALQLANLGTLGARLLPQFNSIPIPIPSIPIPIPSITPVSFSTRSVVPYPYSIYAGARFH